MPIEQPVLSARTMRRASKPLEVRVGPLIRTLTARCARGRRCPRAGGRVCVRMKRLTRRLSGLRASWKQGRGLCMPGRGSWGSRLAGGGSGGRALRSGPRRCRRRECATDCAPNPTERTRSHMRRPTVQLNRGNELRPGVFCMPEAAHLSAATSLPVNGRPVFTRALHQVNFLAT